MYSKSKKKIIIGILLLITVPSLTLGQIKFNIFENLIKIVIQKNIVRQGYLDEVWDFEKVPGEYGYYNWVIGVKAEEISAARIASGSVVTCVGPKELNMHFKSMEDYNDRNGHSHFINFIKDYNKKE